MKAISRRGFVKLGASSAAMLAMTPLLSACGNGGSTGGAPLASSGPVSASKAFAQKGVWFECYDEEKGFPEVKKDSHVPAILVFDGNGNVTRYKIWNSDDINLTFGDLNGKSTDEIVELAKQKAEETFEHHKQYGIDTASELIEKVKDRLNKGLYTNDSQDDVAQADSWLQTLKALEYQEPTPRPYALHIETDDTGNNTAKETLSFVCDALENDSLEENTAGNSFYRIEGDPGFADDDYEIELNPCLDAVTVYDMRFYGYDRLVTIVDENSHGFMFDEPGADGVDVD